MNVVLSILYSRSKKMILLFSSLLFQWLVCSLRLYLQVLCFNKASCIQVKRKIDLVYGGGSVGLMGLVSQKVYDGGCHVLG